MQIGSSLASAPSSSSTIRSALTIRTAKQVNEENEAIAQTYINKLNLTKSTSYLESQEKKIDLKQSKLSKEEFSSLDSDGDGLIDKTELGFALGQQLDFMEKQNPAKQEKFMEIIKDTKGNIVPKHYVKAVAHYMMQGNIDINRFDYTA